MAYKYPYGEEEVKIRTDKAEYQQKRMEVYNLQYADPWYLQYSVLCSYGA